MNLREALIFALERVEERTGVRSDVTFCDMTKGVHHDDCRWCALSQVLAQLDDTERKAAAYDELNAMVGRIGQL